MSDMMRPGAPPPGGAPQGGGVQSKMSLFNPTDLAAKASNGDVRQNQTVGEFLQRNFGVSPQDPVQKLFQSLKGQAKNATVAGKMGMPQGAPRPPQGAQRPQGPPRPQPGAMPPQGKPGGLDALISQM